jgi:hypothetical protein
MYFTCKLWIIYDFVVLETAAEFLSVGKFTNMFS